MQLQPNVLEWKLHVILKQITPQKMYTWTILVSVPTLVVASVLPATSVLATSVLVTTCSTPVATTGLVLATNTYLISTIAPAHNLMPGNNVITNIFAKIITNAFFLFNS